MRHGLVVLLLLSGLSPARAQPPLPIPNEGAIKPRLVIETGGPVGKVASFAFAADGQQIVLVGIDQENTLQIWDVVTRERVRVVRLPPGRGPVLRVAPSPDGKTLAVQARSSTYLLHLESGRILSLPGVDGKIMALRFSGDGDWLAAANPETIWIWRGLKGVWQPDAGKLALWKQLPAPTSNLLLKGLKMDKTSRKSVAKDVRFLLPAPFPLRDLQFAPDGSKLAVCAAVVRKDSLPTTILNSMKPPTPESKGAIWGGFPRHILEKLKKEMKLEYDGQVSVYDLLKPNAPPHEFVVARHKLASLGWSPQGSRLAAIGEDKKLRVWTADGLLLRTTAFALPPNWTPPKAPLLHQPLLRPIFSGEDEVRLLAHSTAAEHAAALVRFDLKTKSRADVQKITAPPSWAGWQLAPDARHLAMKVAPADEVAVLDLDAGDGPRPLYSRRPAPRFALGKTGLKVAWAEQGKPQLLAALDLQTAAALPEVSAAHFRNFDDAKKLGKHPVRQDPNLSGFLTILGKKGQRELLTVYAAGQDWVVWTRQGYYAASPGGEKMVGWQVNNGPNQAASFYPLERFRKKLYRPDVIALVLEKDGVALALKVANALRGNEPLAVIDDLLPPRCTLEVLARDQGKVTVRVQADAQAKGQPILGLRLYVDGRPFVPGGQRGLKKVDTSQTSADFPEGKDKVDLTWTFTLPGEKAAGAYQLAVLARSRDAAGSSNAVAVNFVNPAKVPDLYVLAAGINKYNDASLTLNFAVKDATELAAAFAQHARKGLFAEVHPQVLADQQANRQAFLDHIQEVRNQVKANDLFVVYFAGHGVKEKDQFYLLPVEAQVNALATSALSGADLRKALGEFPCQVLLMLDACHSAGFGENGKLRGKSLLPATDDATRALTEDEIGVAVMCAAMGRETALEKDGNGLFTRAVLDALKRADGVPFNHANHLLYTHHLQAFVFDQVSQQSGERQHPFLSLPWVVQSFPVAKFVAK